MHRPKHLRLVMDGSRSTDIGSELAFAASESFELSLLTLLTLVERRITEAELDELDALGATLPENPDWRQVLDFRVKYWTLLASTSRNPILHRHVLWWMRAIGDLEARSEPRSSSLYIGVGGYLGLSRALRRRQGVVDYWLTVIEPLLLASEHSLNGCK